MMKAILHTCLLLLLLSSSNMTLAKSIRVEVYPISQQYVDINSGDTLIGITTKLLPNNPDMRRRLMIDIVRLNPKAFIENDANKMAANIRLWLPGKMTKADTVVDKSKHDVKTFSWGNIKTPKQ